MTKTWGDHFHFHNIQTEISHVMNTDCRKTAISFFALTTDMVTIWSAFPYTNETKKNYKITSTRSHNQMNQSLLRPHHYFRLSASRCRSCFAMQDHSPLPVDGVQGKNNLTDHSIVSVLCILHITHKFTILQFRNVFTDTTLRRPTLWRNDT
jgi:hypothetical protein